MPPEPLCRLLEGVVVHQKAVVAHVPVGIGRQRVSKASKGFSEAGDDVVEGVFGRAMRPPTTGRLNIVAMVGILGVRSYARRA